MNLATGRWHPGGAPRSRLAVLASALALVAVPFVVQAATVVLVRAPGPGAVATEATVRLRGELVAAGFDVRVIDSPPGTDVRTSLEEAAAAPEVEAVVAIIGGGWEGSQPGGVMGASGGSGAGKVGGSLQAPREGAEVWVIDRVTGKTVVRRVPHEPGGGRGAEVLSIRALELLRASFLEVALAAERSPKVVPQPPPPEVTRWTDAALSDALEERLTSSSTWAVEVGGCVLGSLEGIAPSLMPLARLQRVFGDHLLGRVTVAGLGTSSQLTHELSTTNLDHAEVTQQFGLLEVAARWRKDELWQPFVSGGVGILHLTAAGQTRSPPYEGLKKDRWSLLADLGAGVRLSLRHRFEVALEIHAQGAQPYPVIRFLNEEVAREGRPTLISSLTLLAWL